jgi:uncharacterized protein (UPF0212 family)
MKMIEDEEIIRTPSKPKMAPEKWSLDFMKTGTTKCPSCGESITAIPCESLVCPVCNVQVTIHPHRGEQAHKEVRV